MMENVLIVLALLAIVVSASYYIYRAKKSGQKCIGCPNSRSCKKCACGDDSCGSCGDKGDEKKTESTD